MVKEGKFQAGLSEHIVPEMDYVYVAQMYHILSLLLSQPLVGEIKDNTHPAQTTKASIEPSTCTSSAAHRGGRNTVAQKVSSLPSPAVDEMLCHFS